MSFKEDVFYLFLYVLIGLILLQCLLFIYNIYVIKEETPTQGIGMYIKRLSDVFVPLLSTIGFIPIVFTLTEVYMCVETSGDDLNDAFLRKDCYAECWGTKHVVISAVCGVVLCIYIPLSLHIRPKWQ